MHNVVPLKEEYEEKKVELEKTEAEIQEMIQKRLLKIQEVEHNVKSFQWRKMQTERKQKVSAGGDSQYKDGDAWVEVELKRVQKFAVDVTLDPETAHPGLILSDDGKQVHHSDVRKNLPNNPERFINDYCVLAKQSFSSGRFYFEVQVKGKTDWDLGVTRESINRKGSFTWGFHEIITLRHQKGYWNIQMRNGKEYKALDDPSVLLSLKSGPQKVGVFVDYEEGLVSLYDVEAAALIYSYTGRSFKEKLFPFIYPGHNHGGKNSSPLIISPVNQTG
ncbi:E3 ubiquitin-protein ligase TRIM39-like [Pseudoliparis swirei]|uniref:E3 ubiquitin-protein ligase TRIM39-like n=1 Tax=Pseudoliparis swirei TaxID=2059687 RepID=UPI0024BD8BBE|nr:E3 ubiquitin-protein ligase TRIM39-like [Pseudoliparis swirei]